MERTNRIQKTRLAILPALIQLLQKYAKKISLCGAERTDGITSSPAVGLDGVHAATDWHRGCDSNPQTTTQPIQLTVIARPGTMPATHPTVVRPRRTVFRRSSSSSHRMTTGLLVITRPNEAILSQQRDTIWHTLS